MKHLSLQEIRAEEAKAAADPEQSKIEDIAHDIVSWLQSAIGDMAYSQSEWEGTDYGEAERQADEMYDDPDALSDLCGDKIFDSANTLGYGKDYGQQKVAMWMIGEEIKKIGHEALIIAISNLQERWEQ